MTICPHRLYFDAHQLGFALGRVPPASHDLLCYKIVQNIMQTLSSSQEREGDEQQRGQRGTKRKEKNRDAARKSRRKQTERADELHEVRHVFSSFSPGPPPLSFNLCPVILSLSVSLSCTQTRPHSLAAFPAVC